MSDNLFSTRNPNTANADKPLNGNCPTFDSRKNSEGLDQISFGNGRTNFLETPEHYLLSAARRRDPSVSLVQTNDVKTVKVAAGQRHTIFTHGLGSCTAASVLSQKPDGSAIATMSHYYKALANAHSAAIEREVTHHHRNLPEGTKCSIMVLIYAEMLKLGGTWKRAETDDDIANPLIELTKKLLGNTDVAMKLCPYSEIMKLGKSNAFIIRFTPEDAYPVCYEAHGEYFGELPL